MRIITNSAGYLLEVSFGAEITCNGQSCVEYMGSVPSSYDSLESWYLQECDKLYRWQIVDGELTLDSSAVAPPDNTGGSSVDIDLSDYVLKTELEDYATTEVMNTALDKKANSADIAATGLCTINNSSVIYAKIANLGSWSAAPLGLSILLSSRAGEVVWLSISKTDSNVQAYALRPFNSHSKIAAVYYSLSESTVYCKLQAWSNDLCAHVLSNARGDFTPTVTQNATLPDDAVEINIVEFGVTDTGTQCGDTSVPLALGGSADRPTYNGANMALQSDIPASSDVAQLYETDDGRGVLLLKNGAYPEIESLKAYANTDGSGGLMTRNKTGNQATVLSGSVTGMQSGAGGVLTYSADGEQRTLLGTNTDGDGILRLKDASGGEYLLTPALVQKLIDGLTAAEIADQLANKSDSAHTHDNLYYTESEVDSKLAAANTYAASQAASVKNELLNGAGAAYDTLKELGDLIDENADAIDALETVAASKANASDLTSHTSNKSNPHGVTAAQVGLGNVNNTSDANKPISTATQAALDDKASITEANVYSGEQKFLNSQYCPIDNDNAFGVGCAYKASRGAVTQEIVGQIIMPSTAASDQYGCNNEANTIKFQKIAGTSDGIPTLETVATLTDEAFNAPAFTSGNGAWLTETDDGRGVLLLKNEAYSDIESLKAYANTDGSGGLMTRNKSGNAAVTLSGGVSGMQSGAGGVLTYSAAGEQRTLLGTNAAGNGVLRLKDASGGDHLLTPAMIDQIANPYPVGSIYLSVSSTSPASLFGGTWARLKDRFLLAAGDTYAAGEAKGEATHTLTEDELPEVSGSANIRATAWGSSSSDCSAGVGGVTGKFSQTGLGGSMMSNSYKGEHPYTTLTFAFGSGEAHNNMPPYLAVYVWKRTA